MDSWRHSARPAGEPSRALVGPSSSNVFSGALLCEIVAEYLADDSSADQPSGHRKKTGQLRQRLKEVLPSDIPHATCLTWGLPGRAGLRVSGLLEPRWYWWRQGIPAGRRLGLLSSRLGHSVTARRDWFAALRSVLLRLDPRFDLVVSADTSAAAPYLVRAATLFDLRMIRFRVTRRSIDWADWFLQCLDSLEVTEPGAAMTFPAIPSPPAMSINGPALPLADRLIASASDVIYHRSVRPGGHVAQLMQHLLQEEGTVDQPVRCLSRLVVRGDVSVADRPGADPVPGQRSPGWESHNGLLGDQGNEALHPGAIDLREFLWHGTRASTGPWPGQSEDDYLEAMILSLRDSDHSALGTLLRIVDQKMLCASTQEIRGKYSVVCFTEVPLGQRAARRIRRVHRGRWDFEPYGIGLSRQWLKNHGARPVTYGDESLWQSMAPADRPFFQRRFTRRAASRIDWSTEREWRHLGDLNIRAVPYCDVVVFVPSPNDAKALRSACRWTVIDISSITPCRSWSNDDPHS